MENSKITLTNKVKLLGHDIFYRYRPGTTDNFICVLHGYPTSSLDYDHLIYKIPESYHVIVHDQLGFGNSDKPIGHNYLFSDQADLASALYKSLGAERIHLVAHNYGTSVATEIIARHNEKVLEFNPLSITLCNGSMLVHMAKLRLIQRLLKNRWTGKFIATLSNHSTFHRNMRDIWFNKNLYDKDNMEEHWQLLISQNGKKVLPRITRYIDQRYTYYDRWIGALKQSQLPVHILWAENDPIAIIDMAYELNNIIKNSTLTTIKECGHYPMIEKGEEWLNQTMNFITKF